MRWIFLIALVVSGCSTDRSNRNSVLQEDVAKQDTSVIENSRKHYVNRLEYVDNRLQLVKRYFSSDDFLNNLNSEDTDTAIDLLNRLRKDLEEMEVELRILRQREQD